MRPGTLLFAAILFLSPATARADDISGTWNGTHETDYIYCNNGLKSNGTAKFIIAQNGNAISGTFEWQVTQGTEGCVLTGPETFTFTFQGSVDGNVFNAAFSYPGEGVLGPLTGAVTGNSMTFVAAVIDPESVLIVIGQATRSVPTSPEIVVSSFPAGMIQPLGQPTGTDSFSLTNNSGVPATISLTTSGNFFTLTDTTLTIPARATQAVGIVAGPQSAQTAGVSTGSITGTGGATFSPIRVVLLTAAPPSGTTRLNPPTARQETVAPAGQNPAGSVSFTNSGTSAVQAIAVADVPWIIPQLGVITLAPGVPTAVQFQIDRSKRSDAGNPLGGESGKISLRFLGSATGAASRGLTTHATTPVTTVSVKIYDVVQPATSTRNPPPLGAGVAYFIAAFGAKGNTLTDLLLSNRGSTTIGNLDFYFNSTASAATQFLTLAGFAPNSAVIFPSMPKNVFSAAGHVGSLQIRGSNADLSVMAVQLTSTASGSHGTALPVLRSDAAAAAGERVFLAGVERNAAVRSNLYVQEVGGLSGMFRADYLDADGNVVVAQQPMQIGGFGALEFLDAVPAGAVVARIENLPGSNARIAAFALVVDEMTADSWVVSDLIRSRTPAPDSFVVPLIALNGVSTRDVYLTNVGDSAISASIDAIATAIPRRRVVAHAGGAQPEGNFSIAARHTITPDVAIANGYLRISAPAGMMAASARVTAPNATGGSYGTGLAAVATAGALASGQSKRFTGVDDASSTTVISGTPGTYRSSLILIETSGQSATVRVTMNFSFASGGKVSGFAAPTKVVQLAAGQMLTLTDIGRAVMGSQRDSFGDLSNTQIDVEVLSGSGRVVSLIQSIDNGSGDAIVLVE